MSNNDDDHDGDRDESRDVVITAALRKAVVTAFQVDRDAVTLRYIRTAVEKELGLGVEFLKCDPYWKDKSKSVVIQEVVCTAVARGGGLTRANRFRPSVRLLCFFFLCE